MAKKIFGLFVFFITILTFTSAHALDITQQSAIQNLIYGGSYGSAKTKIEAAIQADSSDPVPQMLMGMYYQWYQLNHNKGNALNGTILGCFEKAKGLAEAAVAKDPTNIANKVILGNVMMYLAKTQVDMGHKMQAGNTLKKAKEIMEGVVAVDPNNADAYFAMGMFNYFAANVPSGLKWLAALMGLKGNKNLGLQQIQRAASVPNLTQVDAKFILVYINSKKENNFPGALPYAKSLYSRYPSNLAFMFDYAEMLERAKLHDESRVVFGKVFAVCGKSEGACNKQMVFLSNLFMAMGYVDQKDYTSARDYVLKADELRAFAGTKDRIALVDAWLKLVK